MPDMGRASSFKRMYKNSLHAAFYTYKIAPMKITFDSAKDAASGAADSAKDAGFKPPESGS